MRYTGSCLILLAAIAFGSPARAQVIANPDSGTADFGLSSMPISNVAANDTVDGAQAILGASGNATVAKSGTWPAGLGLNPTNGSVSTGVSLAAGAYTVFYNLCEKSAPTDCNTGTITVTVINSVISPVADSGTADFGIASQPIANVAANDTVNGAPAVLGSSGNAAVMESGTWPTGIALNPATGAVSTTKTVAVGQYTVAYKLCDLNLPKNCATVNDTVTVVNPSIVANPDSGTADFGIASLPITNVTLNDSINGALVVLGAGGNAKITAVGTWGDGIALNPTTGAVSTRIATPDGPYTFSYKLCDLNSPADCVTTTVTVNVITASILANPVSGIGEAGIASTPIANVVAGTPPDTVNGAAATLGAGGNAQLTTVGTWPTGINLFSATGAVTLSRGVPAGVYDLDYELCDLNVPANCAAGPIEITVTTSVVANPDNGTALAGKAATPIHNVAINDTVNGVEARLQTNPNATVSAVGTWPAGIVLNTTTGAVTTTASVLPGIYEFTYQLCNLAATPKCATALDTLNVEASVVAATIAGSATVGVPSTVIRNVLAHDTVNGVEATLGKSGNAKVSPLGTWPTGITLTATGAVTTTADAALGNYVMQYQLCDKATPPDCSPGLVGVSVTEVFQEVSVSPYMTGDIEFDWARDGLYCASCNYGASNSQVNWTDRNNKLWVSGVNATTGAFTPISGHGTTGVPVDTTAFFWEDWGNGPEWGFSTPPGAPGGNPISQLVYSRFAPGNPPTWEYTGAAIATQTAANTWSYDFFPGAYNPVTNNTVLPVASQCPSDPVSYALFEDFYATKQMFTEPLSTAPGTVPTNTQFGALANGIGERFFACGPNGTTQSLTFQGDVTIGDNSLQQVYWYDMTTQVAQQLTFDPTTKQRAIMFRAPEFNGAVTLMTLAAANKIEILVQNGTYPNGAPMMQLMNTIYSPDPTESFMFDPKVFIHCTAQYPTCKSYVTLGISAVANSQQTETDANGLAVAAIDPENPMFVILATAAPQNGAPAAQRLDPKYFITQNGPVLYYDLLTTLTTSAPYNDEGIYLINLQLGPPSGPCVGSSAYDGLNPTWPNCTAGAPP